MGGTLPDLGGEGGDRQGITSFSRHGNRFVFQARDGTAELEWNTPSTFRFRRTFALQLPPRSVGDSQPIPVAVKETAESITFSTTFVRTTIRRADLRISVRSADGKLVMADLTGAQRRDGAITWGGEARGARALLRPRRTDGQHSQPAWHAGARCCPVSDFDGRLWRTAYCSGKVRFRSRETTRRKISRRRARLRHDRLLLLFRSDT